MLEQEQKTLILMIKMKVLKNEKLNENLHNMML